MKEKLTAVLRGPVVYYPLLLAVFPILFLYAYNISEMSAGQIILPLVVSLLGTLILWAILSLLLRSIPKAGLATAIFLFFFFSYGRFYDFLENWRVFVPGHAYLLPSILFIWGYCVYFISRARTDFGGTTKVLNVIAVVLIAVNLFNIGYYSVTTALSPPAKPAGAQQAAVAATDPEKLKALPDIYLIIMDEYAHPDTMKKYYGYDNSAFIQRLEQRGFFVAKGSETRTRNTLKADATVLNMEFIDDTQSDEFARYKNANSDVVSFLKSNGYYYACFDFPHLFGGTPANADLNYDYWGNEGSMAVHIDFPRLLWGTTMVKPFYNYFTGSQYEAYFRGIVTNTLETLKKAPSLKGPKFVFAHIVCPHEPFVFGPNGEEVDISNFFNYRDKQFYLGQYIYMSHEIEKVVDTILNDSVNEPIIIVQSDHGIRPSNPGIDIGQDEWRKILNAYYFPGGGKELLYQSISPVNSFRLIFNYYFGADYTLLEEGNAGHD